MGKSKNADINTPIVDGKGNIISDPKEAIRTANVINPEENDHTYDEFKRIKTTDSEDKNAIKNASESAASENYGIAGPGKSCIDVAQAAFGSVVKDRELDNNGNVPGQSDLIPNNWFNNLQIRIDKANENTTNNNQKINGVKYKKE